VRNGDWKLLFSPTEGSASPLRVELYNMSISQLARNGGAFFEAQNFADAYPEVVDKMVAEVMPWHASTPIPFGAPNNTGTNKRFQPGGCESYPFPGLRRHGPDQVRLEDVSPLVRSDKCTPLTLPLFQSTRPR
jgi:hypothetical protein